MNSGPRGRTDQDLQNYLAAAEVVEAGLVPCWGDVGLSVPGGVSQSGSAEKCDEVMAGAERAACAGKGWSVVAATVVLARAVVT